MSQILINAYLADLDRIKRLSGSLSEQVIREAFKDMLKAWSRQQGLVFLAEHGMASNQKTSIRPDGTILHDLRVPLGYWEAKDTADDLDTEIKKKFTKGYPQDNIIFENSVTAVLIQNRSEVMRCSMTDTKELERLLNLFFGYERPEIAQFRQAVRQFQTDLPAILEALRERIDTAYRTNTTFKETADKFLAHAKDTINPTLGEADVREMLIQHILTEEIFTQVFDGGQFHRENNIAKELFKLEAAFFTGAVAEQRRLIDLLKEKRQAVISHAVTRGLNPDAKLKPSGVDWLGDVPEGWEVKRLRFLSQIETGSSDTQDADDDAEFPFFVRSDTVERIGHFTHDCEAVMTSGDGAGVGKIFHHFDGKFSAHQRVYIFTDFQAITGKFFFHYLKANFFKVALEGGAKSTVDSLRRPLIANFWMTVPPATAQDEIVEFIESADRQFSELASAAEAAITLLQERRAALISAAVTGKIDVRDLVSQETEAA